MKTDSATHCLVEAPDIATIDAVAMTRPDSPFAGRMYVDAMSSVGVTPCALLETVADDVTGCMGFISSRPGLSRLFIPSMAKLQYPAAFWSIVRATARDIGVADILVESYASQQPSLPPVCKDTIHAARYEYLWSLGSEDALSAISTNHRRNIRKAKSQDVEVIASTRDDDVNLHCDLALQSLARQASKMPGVDVVLNSELIHALVTSGCAQVWQAWKQGSCVSSVVILKNSRAAYYFSAGSSDDGQKFGASAHLVASIAEDLSKNGVAIFNLGGANTEETGLRRFKAGFGAHEVRLAKASVRLVSGATRLATKLRNRLFGPRTS